MPWRRNFGPHPLDLQKFQQVVWRWLTRHRCTAPATPRVDRLNAIRLLKALVTAGAKPRAPMTSAWIDEIAVRDLSFHGTQLASALAYAEGQRWLADSRTRDDWIYLTRTGEIVAKRGVI